VVYHASALGGDWRGGRRVRVLGGSCLGVGGGADGNRDRGQAADGGWVMVVVGPMGVPPLDLVAAGEVFPPLKPENKSTVTVVVEGKKTKVRVFWVFF
jgi:hypothetical protein